MTLHTKSMDKASQNTLGKVSPRSTSSLKWLFAVVSFETSSWLQLLAVVPNNEDSLRKEYCHSYDKSISNYWNSSKSQIYPTALKLSEQNGKRSTVFVEFKVKWFHQIQVKRYGNAFLLIKTSSKINIGVIKAIGNIPTNLFERDVSYS